MPKSVSQTMQDELEPILHDSTERDESDEIETEKLMFETSASDEFHEDWRKFELIEDE